MIGILIVTHGTLGDALIGSATHILGKPPENLRVLPVRNSDRPEDLLENAREQIAALDEGQGVLLLSDICGGTPCNVVTRLVVPGRIEAVSGVSLPMLVRALTYRHLSLSQVVDKALSGGTEGVIQLHGEAANATSRS